MAKVWSKWLSATQNNLEQIQSTVDSSTLYPHFYCDPSPSSSHQVTHIEIDKRKELIHALNDPFSPLPYTPKSPPPPRPRKLRKSRPTVQVSAIFQLDDLTKPEEDTSGYSYMHSPTSSHVPPSDEGHTPRKLTKRSKTVSSSYIPSAFVPTATPFVTLTHSHSDPTSNRRRTMPEPRRKAFSDCGHGSSEWTLPPMRPSSPLKLDTHPWRTSLASRHYPSTNRDTLASLAWTGVDAPQRWSLAIADEALSDEDFVGELERFCEQDEVTTDTGEWLTAQRALLSCRELVRTERRYQEGLRALIRGDTRTTPPPLMATYLPALLRVSENLLAQFEADPSAWGVAAAFLGYEEALEVAFVSWSGVVGEFFAGPHVFKSPSASSLAQRRTPFAIETAWRKSMTEAWVRKRALPSVRDLAIQPTQRVMRYVLLYRELLAHTPSSSASRVLVEGALQAARRIAYQCDRAQENAAFLHTR